MSTEPGATHDVECPMLSDVLAWKRQVRGHAYALLDAAAGDAIAAWIQRSGLPSAILFNGQLADALSDTGPYLVPLPGSDATLTDLVRSGWQENWGILLDSRLDPENLRAHLRYFTAAALPTGERVLFAFYDPRVALPFLEAATNRQHADFMAPLESVALPRIDDDGKARLEVVGPRPGREPAANPPRPLAFSQDQMAHFEAAVKANHVHRLTRRMREGMPTATRGRSYREVHQVVSSSMVELDRLGSHSDASATRFVSLSLQAGRPITTLRPVHRYLAATPGMSLDEKLSRLSKHFATHHLRLSRPEAGRP